MITKTDLFEDMAVALDYWVKDSSDLLTNSDVDSSYLENAESYNNIRSVLINSGIDSESLKIVLSDMLRGYSISILSILDGATESAERGRIYLVDEEGVKLGEGLHDDFVSHLLNTGRMI